MKRVEIDQPELADAFASAIRALPFIQSESPRQYGRRWYKAYGCRIEPGRHFPQTVLVFDRDEDYTMFLLKWSA